MGYLQLYLGRAGSGKSYTLYKKIIEESEKEPGINQIIVVPEQFTLQTQKDIVNLHPRGGILNIDVLSFQRLAFRIFEEIGFNKARGKILDDMGKNLILRRVASLCSDSMPFLGPNLKKLGYISEVKSVISEFKQYGIGDREIKKLIEKAEKRGLLAEKLKEIHALYNTFEQFIKDNYITAEELMERCGNCIPESKKMKTSVISFDGFTGFTPVQYKVIKALLETCPGINISLLADNNDIDEKNIFEEHELFNLSKKTIFSLKKMTESVKASLRPDIVIDQPVPFRYILPNSRKGNEGSKNPESPGISDFDPSTEGVVNPKIIFLEQNLFRKGKPVYQGGFSEDLMLYRGGNREEELIYTAVKINELIREKGYSYYDIAVVTGDIDKYLHICERIFNRYGIPFFIDKSLPVLLDPLTEYIRGVIKIITDDYSYKDMMRYLRSYLTDISMEEADVLENYILACGIRGRKQWQEGFKRKRKRGSLEETEFCDKVREAVIAPFMAFEEALGGKSSTPDSTFSGKYKVKDISAALYEFIVSNNTERKLYELSKETKLCGDDLKAGELSRIYVKVMDLLDQMVELLKDEEITISEYGELLDAGFEEIRIGVVPKDQDYVQVGDIKRSRLRKIKALFFIGVNDGIIPETAQKGGLITDMDREFLTEGEDEIVMAPTCRQLAYIQRLYLYMVLSKPREKLFISYAETGDDGDALKPSYLIKIISEMFPGIQFDLQGQDLENRIVNEKTGIFELAARVSDFSSFFGREKEKSREKAEIEYLSLFRFFRLNNMQKETLDRTIRAAFGQGSYSRKTSINKTIANVIYKGDLSGNITRLEQYAACAYDHFLTYGLRLHEREEFSFEARELGSVFHEGLNYYGILLSKKGMSWQEVSEEMRDSLIEEALDNVLLKDDYDAVRESARTLYIRERVKRFLKRSVDTLSWQLGHGSFSPYRFELPFNRDGEIRELNIELSDGGVIYLNGRIDRLDIYKNDGDLYYKIIDYKSGRKELDPESLFEGIQLQLPVYMMAAREYLKRGFKQALNFIPAGMFLYHIDDPVVLVKGGESPEETELLIRGELRMKGLVNSEESVYKLMDSKMDPHTHGRSLILPLRIKSDGSMYPDSCAVNALEFEVIMDYIKNKIRSMGDAILEGDISIEPQLDKKGNSACDYCGYKNICRIGNKKGKKAVNISGFPEMIELMKKALGEGGES